jgi:uncharacterized protein DUF2252
MSTTQQAGKRAKAGTAAKGGTGAKAGTAAKGGTGPKSGNGAKAAAKKGGGAKATGSAGNGKKPGPGKKGVAAAPAEATPRLPHPALTARSDAGLAARERVPLADHAAIGPEEGRPDPIDLLLAQAETREPGLVPLRHGRMLVTPFTFYRGAAVVMATDLATVPDSGLHVQACGDAHLLNFGMFGSPERRLMFDVNDFDETYPGPFEWDVKRLAASMVIAARDRGFDPRTRRKIVLGTVGGYRTAMAQFAAMPLLEVWYARADVDEQGPELAAQLSRSRRKALESATAKARTRTSLQAAAKLTAVVDGQRRFLGEPPLLVPIADLLPGVAREELVTVMRDYLRRYRRTLQDDRRRLLEGYEYVDLARKVVGVGSVGTRCWVMLLRGRDDDDLLLLQIKEAQPSVLAGRARAVQGRRPYRNEGERVVVGQRLMQATSDIFLGWESLEGLDGKRRDFYVRQLRDWKGSLDTEQLQPRGARVYGGLCGWTLARAHARSGDAVAIAAYLGDDTTFDEALVEFAEAYADRNERDHAALVEAVRTGRVAAETGV